jgi:hypothetical protein
MRDLFFMPRLIGRPFYPNGLPLTYKNAMAWQGNSREMVEEAVHRYYSYALKKIPALPPQDSEIIMQYITYYIHAPVWEMTTAEAFEDELKELRRKADEMKSIDELPEFIYGCLEIGLDPL